ncbi:RidA family protein [Egbenema bharatensis]|uniref:RidA family protein n=1 Tax=Egbenema bharatensis TaxID=3463334 RepID=UPI003A85E64B
MKRQQISTGTPWESIAGYSRAVRVGNLVFVAGTTAADDTGQIQHPGDPYGQTAYILRKIEAALQAVDAQLTDVVRTRVYVANMDDWQSIAKAHREWFEQIRPVNAMVEVSRLATPEMLVEIEVDAVVVE